MQKKPRVIPPREASTSKLPTRDYRIMDFDVIQEGWNKYKLENGVIIKSKFVLINVMMDKNLEELVKEAKEKKEPKMRVGMAIQSRNVMGVEAPKELRGLPSAKCSPKELQVSIIEKDMEFEVIKERRNAYKLKNGITIKVRHSPIEIAKTSKFDSQGLPIHLVNSTADIKITFPEEVEKELKKLKRESSEQKSFSAAKHNMDGGETT